MASLVKLWVLVAKGADGLISGIKGLRGKKPPVTKAVNPKEGKAVQMYDNLGDGVPETSMSREVRKIEGQRASVESQTMEAGQLELELPGIGGYKTNPLLTLLKAQQSHRILL